MKRNHLFSIITAGMLTITLLAGCGNTGSNANADPGSNTNTVQESTEDQASAVPESEAQITGEGQNGETIIVTDVRGEVEIPADPQRIVDLSGNSDILSILGYSVVGTANSDAYDYTKFPTYLEDTLQGAEILGYSMQDTMEEINNNGTTVVVVTHNLEIVKAMNKRVITMQKGVIVDDSDTASSIVTGDNAISRSLTERDVLKREGDYDYED